MSDTMTINWETQAFPDSRLATLVVAEKPLAILAKLFGVWEADIDANHPTIPDAVTYNGLFRVVQEVIVDQITSLLARATDAINLFPNNLEEARAGLLELALIDAQQATLHYAQELWFHAACREDSQANDFLKDWEPEKAWEFLELSDAIKHEGATKKWKLVESNPNPDSPTPGGPSSRLLAIPLRSVLPTQAKRQPFREPDWFTSRATAATIGARVNRRKRAVARAIGAGSREPEGTQNPADVPDDVQNESGSEPEAEADEDPLDPEPNFQRHPNQWMLWVMRRERRKAESASALRAEPRGVAGRNPPVHAKSPDTDG
jgi:hypothetical protein